MSMIPWWREPTRHDFSRMANSMALDSEVTDSLSVQVSKEMQELTNPELHCARCQKVVTQKDTHLTGLGAG